MIHIYYNDTEGKPLEMSVSRSIYVETMTALINAGCQVTEVRNLND